MKHLKPNIPNKNEHFNEKRVAFYIKQSTCRNLSLKTILSGNPGIGGTEYTTLVLANLLSHKGFETIVYSDKPLYDITDGITNRIADNVDDSLKMFGNDDGGFFICRTGSTSFIGTEQLSNIKIILWVHNDYFDNNIWNKIARQKNICSVVFLTKEQYNAYSIYPYVLKKSCVIGHFCLGKNVELNDKKRLLNHNVTFLGNPRKSKSFDVLIDVWPLIVAKVQDAHLYVCGSSDLYGENNGSIIFGNNDYEKKIINYLKEKRLLDTVSFLGTLGFNERDRVLRNSKIGVVNPSIRGEFETFCISAIDFGSLGVPVVGGDAGGLKNTLPKNCGYRIKTKKQLVDKIVRALNNDDENYKKGLNYYEFVNQHYLIDIFEEKWLSLLTNNHKKKVLIYTIPQIWRCIKYYLKNFLSQLKK